MTTRSVKIQHGLTPDHTNTLERLIRQVRAWARQESLRRQLKRERRQLLAMDDETLADLGITRAAAEVEARRDDIPAERLAPWQRTRED